GTGGVTALAVGNFNGDADPDLAVVDAGHDTVAVLTGGAGAAFAAPAVSVAFGRAAGSAAGATGLVASDFDGDGDDDLAVARAVPGPGRPALAVLTNVDVPTAVGDRYTIEEDAPGGLSVPAPGILDNDEPGEALKPQVVKADADHGPFHGTVAVGKKGDFVYTPEQDFNGTDSFAYTVTDEAGVTSAPATVEITV